MPEQTTAALKANATIVLPSTDNCLHGFLEDKRFVIANSSSVTIFYVQKKLPGWHDTDLSAFDSNLFRLITCYDRCCR